LALLAAARCHPHLVFLPLSEEFQVVVVGSVEHLEFPSLALVGLVGHLSPLAYLLVQLVGLPGFPCLPDLLDQLLVY
jgi:hypothetical protein